VHAHLDDVHAYRSMMAFQRSLLTVLVKQNRLGKKLKRVVQSRVIHIWQFFRTQNCESEHAYHEHRQQEAMSEPPGAKA
jgi:hypothetical protein